MSIYQKGEMYTCPECKQPYAWNWINRHMVEAHDYSYWDNERVMPSNTQSDSTELPLIEYLESIDVEFDAAQEIVRRFNQERTKAAVEARILEISKAMKVKSYSGVVERYLFNRQAELFAERAALKPNNTSGGGDAI